MSFLRLQAGIQGPRTSSEHVQHAVEEGERPGCLDSCHLKIRVSTPLDDSPQDIVLAMQ